MLHIDNSPAFRLGLIKGSIQATDLQLSVIRPFPFRISAMNTEAEARPGAGVGPLEHLQVVAGVANRCKDYVLRRLPWQGRRLFAHHKLKFRHVDSPVTVAIGHLKVLMQHILVLVYG